MPLRSPLAAGGDGDRTADAVQDPAQHWYPDSTCSGSGDHPHFTGFTHAERTRAPVFLLYRMQTSTIGYPDNVIIFVFIEASVAYGLFIPEIQDFSTGSYICFVVIVAGPANKLRAEVAIKIIAENSSFSLGC